ncbi:zinc finger BED domain-containing protein 4-like [Clavelina lepadiformis]|uniref:zinc finger BED domain-containing protein 4-like n=1 Tax=Clavelina lepadiformis TaxID=159417 RepID=UPI004042B2EB
MTSEVWKYFEVCDVDHTKSICTLCQKRICRGKLPSTFTTTPMRRHLEARHKIRIKSLRTAEFPKHLSEVVASASEDSSSNVTETPPPPKRPRVAKVTVSSQLITQKIAEMIALDFIPPLMIDGNGFRQLLKELEPQYSAPSTSQLSNSVLPQLLKELKGRLNATLGNSAGLINGSVDIQAGQDNTMFLLVAVHAVVWEKGSLKRITPLLACRKINTLTAYEDIRIIIKQQENSWNLNMNAFINGDNSIVHRALKQSNYLQLKCIGVTLDSIVTLAWKCCSFIKETITLTRSVASFINQPNNVIKLQDYQSEQGLRQSKLIVDNSKSLLLLYNMVHSAIESKEVINFLATEIGYTKLEDSHWNTLHSIRDILKPFKTALVELTANTASIALVLPAITKLKSILVGSNEKYASCHEVNLFVSALLQNMESVFVKPELGKSQAATCFFVDESAYNYYAMASMLDPRIKDSWASDDEKLVLKDLLESAAMELFEEVQEEESTSEAGTEDNEIEPTESLIFSYSSNRSVKSESEMSSAMSREMHCQMQVYQYLAAPLSNCDPFQFWIRYNYENAPLFKLAMNHLSCFPVAIKADELLNAKNMVVSPRHISVDHTTFETLAFLHVNLRNM